MVDAKLKPKVILVADRTLSANYATLFEGMFATMQTTQVPSMLFKHFIAPPIPVDKYSRARYAPIGLRRLESALLKHTGLDEREVACTTPEALPRLLGPWVKIVAISSSDPLGYGMSNTTTSNFWKGELYTRFYTRRMLRLIHCAKQRFGFTVVGGGAGAWQWRTIPDETAENALDVIYQGYFESTGPGVFEDILNNKSVERYVECGDTGIGQIQPIREASVFGSVELSRGCGRGCCFCSMSRQRMTHVPADTILADIETNLSMGVTSVVSGSEDFLRYGTAGLKPDFEKLVALLEQMRSLKDIGFMQIDHANITSAAQLTSDQLRQIRKLLTWNRPHKHMWVNLGVESANGGLVAANCPGKVAPYRADDWDGLVRETVVRLIEAGFTPVLSLVLGLPGETPSDIEQTQKMINDLGDRRIVAFPIFYEPIGIPGASNDERFTLSKMRLDHLHLYRSCYELNFGMVPKLIWDNQTAAGVSWMKRFALQMLGKAEIVKWRRTFVKIEKKLTGREESAKRGLEYAV